MNNSRLILFSLVILCQVSWLQAAGNIQGDTLTIDQIDVDGSNYSATLTRDPSSGPVPSYQLNDTQPVETENNADSVYLPSSQTAHLQNIIIENTPYDMVLQRNDQNNQFKVLQLNNRELINWLYMLDTDTIQFLQSGTYENKSVGQHFLIDRQSHFFQFSDRPFRIAKEYHGGLNRFADTFVESDFTTNPPNVSFYGISEAGEKVYSVFEIDTPFISGEYFVLPVKQAIGDMQLPPFAQYSSANLVFDGLFDFVKWAMRAACNSTLSKALEPVVLDMIEAGTEAGCLVVSAGFIAGCNVLLDAETAFLGGLVCDAVGAAFEVGCAATGALTSASAGVIAKEACSKI